MLSGFFLMIFIKVTSSFFKKKYCITLAQSKKNPSIKKPRLMSRLSVSVHKYIQQKIRLPFLFPRLIQLPNLQYL